MKKEKLRKRLIAGLAIFILVDLVYLGKWLFDVYKMNNQEKEVAEIVDKNSDDGTYKMTYEAFQELKSQYPNMVAYIEFPNDYLGEIVAQTDDNEYYLTHWIDDTWTTQGTVFMNWSCTSNSQNITLYGHHVEYDSNAKFSPVAKLADQEVYDEHHTFKVWYEDHVSEYVVSYVTDYNEVTDKNFDYKVSEFYLQNIFDGYKDWLDKNQMIKPVDGSELTKTDKMITLQTCKSYGSEDKINVTGKEIAREGYTEGEESE